MEWVSTLNARTATSLSNVSDLPATSSAVRLVSTTTSTLGSVSIQVWQFAGTTSQIEASWRLMPSLKDTIIHFLIMQHHHLHYHHRHRRCYCCFSIVFLLCRLHRPVQPSSPGVIIVPQRYCHPCFITACLFYHRLPVPSYPVCSIIACLSYHRLPVPSPPVCSIIVCLFRHHLSVLPSPVCSIIVCLFHPRLSVLSSPVCSIIVCLFHPRLSVLSSPVCSIIVCLFHPRLSVLSSPV